MSDIAIFGARSIMKQINIYISIKLLHESKSMNTISKKVNAVLFAIMVACAPVCASENQTMEMVSEQQDTANEQNSVVWYKKRSTHIMAAFAATAVGIYAIAVRKNKIAGPVALLTAGGHLLKSLFFCANKKAQEVKNEGEVKDAGNKQQPEDTDAQLQGQDNGSKDVKKEESTDSVVNSEDQTGEKKEDGQTALITENVEEQNTQATNEAYLGKAQEHLFNAVSGLKNWLKQGL